MPSNDLYADSRNQVLARWADGRPAVVGEPTEEGKLTMLPEAALKELLALADIAFLEADGAKRLPMKVPADGEPVLLPQSDIVVAVCGLSALGQPLSQVCFRLKWAKALLNKDAEEPVTEADLACILTSEAGSRRNVGTRDYHMVLNQCDSPARLAQVSRVADMLCRQGWDRLTATCFNDPDKRRNM
jgi:probable selenium-dependent hydroxylase accessory protein YqeC